MMRDDMNQNENTEVFATASAPDLGIDPEECLAPQRSDPCSIVIMGATGDLTARKLIPALYNLYLNMTDGPRPSTAMFVTGSRVDCAARPG